MAERNCLADGFLFHAGRSPERSALYVAGQAHTYGKVLDAGMRWARAIEERCQSDSLRVSVFASRSFTSYVGVLAAQLCGATYVPLNPRLPRARVRLILEQAQVHAILVGSEALGAFLDILNVWTPPEVILMPEVERSAIPSGLEPYTFSLEDLAATACIERVQNLNSDAIAYLLFTSGSTGPPKGVPISHGNVRAFLDFNSKVYKFTPEDRLSQTFDQTFDLSVFDLFMAWENGASVYSISSSELLSPFDFVNEHRLTVWFSVPTVATHLMRRGALRPNEMPTLRWSLFCGEGLPRATAESWQSAAPNSVLENLYGPTELTIACSAYRWNRERSPSECLNELVPIGDIYSSLSHVVLDGSLDLVAEGAIGELCVAGPQTFRGYLDGQNTEKFCSHSGADGRERTYFRTGDLVRRVNGKYCYIGRRDHQIKINGYRVDAGDIEAAVRSIGIPESAAFGWPDDLSAEEIVVVVAGGIESGSVRRLLRDHLPPYLIPKSIRVMERLPLNVNGKIDRRQIRSWLSRQV